MNFFIAVRFSKIEVHLCNNQSSRTEGGKRSSCTAGRYIGASARLVENLGVDASTMCRVVVTAAPVCARASYRVWSRHNWFGESTNSSFGFNVLCCWLPCNE